MHQLGVSGSANLPAGQLHAPVALLTSRFPWHFWHRRPPVVVSWMQPAVASTTGVSWHLLSRLRAHRWCPTLSTQGWAELRAQISNPLLQLHPKLCPAVRAARPLLLRLHPSHCCCSQPATGRRTTSSTASGTVLQNQQPPGVCRRLPAQRVEDAGHSETKPNSLTSAWSSMPMSRVESDAATGWPTVVAHVLFLSHTDSIQSSPVRIIY